MPNWLNALFGVLFRLARFSANVPAEVKTEQLKVVSLKTTKRPSGESVEEIVSPSKIFKFEPVSSIKYIGSDIV